MKFLKVLLSNSRVTFQQPQGTNFRTSREVPLDELSRALCAVVAFLQHRSPATPLQRYEDWWEHDGMHFDEGSMTWDQLFALIRTPKDLLESMTGEFMVHVGIAPRDNLWYLRFMAWDPDEQFLSGKFDITLPPEQANEFEREILPNIPVTLHAESAVTYYARIITH
jgi:hypothetical protein